MRKDLAIAGAATSILMLIAYRLLGSAGLPAPGILTSVLLSLALIGLGLIALGILMKSPHNPRG